MKNFWMTILALLTFSVAEAAHIGGKEITRIRHTSENRIVVWLESPIADERLASCATVSNKIAYEGLSDKPEWAGRQLSMLMTAMVTGYKIDPNCSNQCSPNYDGQITICSEVSIQK